MQSFQSYEICVMVDFDSILNAHVPSYSPSDMQTCVKILKFTSLNFKLFFNITNALRVSIDMVIFRCFEGCC
jgi:hypothetical protein